MMVWVSHLTLAVPLYRYEYHTNFCSAPGNMHIYTILGVHLIPSFLLPARASEQGNVIGSVRIYIYIQKKL